jgi:Tfp pilus assembly protein PilX
MNKKGIVLLIGLMVITVLTILGSVIISRSISESRVVQRNMEATQAFWLSEAGINQALKGLRGDYTLTNIPSTTLPPGAYSATIVENADGTRTVTARGCIPSGCNCTALPNNCRVTRIVEAVMNKYEVIPEHFYENAIYTAGNVNIGSNCVVNGDALSGGTITGNVQSPYTKTENDPTLNESGLPALDFDELRQKSIDQGWYNPITETTTFPTSSFYYIAPSPTYPEGVPNVVFVSHDFDLVGGRQIVKGFIVVGGNTVYDAEIGGNASIDGCLYTRGNVWLHGGGGNIINVQGGVWSGGTTTLQGNEQINYNVDYMDAIRVGLHPSTVVQLTSWKDKQNPYPLSP